MSKDYNRQQNGRFGKGNDGGPGRPAWEGEKHARDVFNGKITDQDLEDIARSHVNFAKAGNVQSARLIFDYKLGRPTEHLAISNEGDQVIDWSVGDVKVIEPPTGEDDTQPNGEFLLPENTTPKDRQPSSPSDNGTIDIDI